MKKLINGVDNVVDEMLRGMTAAHPEYVERVEGTDVVIRTGAKKTDKVVLISGGGSGHEPAHGGFVGKGMLDGAVAGAVFTSPTPDQVYEAIKATECGKGALLIIKNYTGDVLNFEMAADMAADEDIEVAQVIVADDVAVENSTWTTGRRGIAGTIFVHKIAGAKAEEGASLEEVKAVAEKVIANVRTHKEKIKTANETVDHMLGKILAEGIYNKGDEVAVMVNGMGATPLSELYIANLEVSKVLADKGIVVRKTLVGNYMTSLDMAGFSITLLKLDDELEALLNAPADTPAFRQF